MSDSYDPEWSTSANAQLITDALDDMYSRVSAVLGNKPPIYILDLVRQEPGDEEITASLTLTEQQWRIIRFALERAKESI